MLVLLDPLMYFIGDLERRRLRKRPLRPGGVQLKQFHGEFRQMTVAPSQSTVLVGATWRVLLSGGGSGDASKLGECRAHSCEHRASRL